MQDDDRDLIMNEWEKENNTWRRYFYTIKKSKKRVFCIRSIFTNIFLNFVLVIPVVY